METGALAERIAGGIEESLTTEELDALAVHFLAAGQCSPTGPYHTPSFLPTADSQSCSQAVALIAGILANHRRRQSRE